MEVIRHVAGDVLPNPRGTIVWLEAVPTAGRDGPAWNAHSHGLLLQFRFLACFACVPRAPSRELKYEETSASPVHGRYAQTKALCAARMPYVQSLRDTLGMRTLRDPGSSINFAVMMQLVV